MNDESYADSDEIEEMPDEPGIYIEDFLEQIQKQLTALEKKVDMLLKQTQGERPFDKARPPAPGQMRKPYGKPFQRFDRPARRDRNDGGGGRERGHGRDDGWNRDSGRGRDDGEGRERGHGRRDNEPSRDRHFGHRKTGKKPGGKQQRSSFGKKPFYSR